MQVVSIVEIVQEKISVAFGTHTSCNVTPKRPEIIDKRNVIPTDATNRNRFIDTRLSINNSRYYPLVNGCHQKILFSFAGEFHHAPAAKNCSAAAMVSSIIASV